MGHDCCSMNLICFSARYSWPGLTECRLTRQVCWIGAARDEQMATHRSELSNGIEVLTKSLSGEKQRDSSARFYTVPSVLVKELKEGNHVDFACSDYRVSHMISCTF